PNLLVLRVGDLEPLGALSVRAFADHGHRRSSAPVAIEALDLLIYLTEDRFVECDSPGLFIAHESSLPGVHPATTSGLGSPRGCAASHGGGLDQPRPRRAGRAVASAG